MPEITEHYRIGKAVKALRDKHGRDGYIGAARRDARFAGRSARWMQWELEFFGACHRCGITDADLVKWPGIKHGSVRNKLAELTPPKGRAIQQLLDWSSATSRESTHKRRTAAHADFSDAVAVVMHADGRRWSVAFAVERGHRNFDWRSVSDLDLPTAIGLVAGVGWSARNVVLQTLGGTANACPSLERLLRQLDTHIVKISANDRSATPAGALSALRVKASKPTLERVCAEAGWRQPDSHDAHVARAICLLTTARVSRRSRGD